VAGGAASSTSSSSSSPVYGELTVYSWGRGEDGQLGIGDTSDQDEPTYVDSLRGVGVKEIACGSGHTVVLTVEGEVYTWYVHRLRRILN
jgi:alpha-tubulin suppressor-like RCC1 family protein